MAEFRKVRSPKVLTKPNEKNGKVFKLANAMNSLKVGEALELSATDACAAGFIGTVVRAVTTKQFRRAKVDGKIYLSRVS